MSNTNVVNETEVKQFQQTINDKSIQYWVSIIESRCIVWKWFERENDTLFSSDRTEPARWIRNPFHKDDDRNGIDNFDILWKNSIKKCWYNPCSNHQYVTLQI